MKVWRMHHHHEALSIAALSDRKYARQLSKQLLLGESIENWEVIHLETSTAGQYADFASFMFGIPLWSAEVVELLKPLVGKSVQFMPVSHPDHHYFIGNILNIVDSIDHSRAISEKDLGMELFLSYTSYAFNDEWLSKENNMHIFRIPELDHHIFVSDEFARSIVDNGINGVFFELVYDSETWIDIDPIATQRYPRFIAQQVEVGQSYDWQAVLKGIEQGRAYASRHWKVQLSETGDRIFGQLRKYLDYHFFFSDNTPKELTTIKWYEAERSNI